MAEIIYTEPETVGPRRTAAGIDDVSDRNSAVSWPAIFAGAAGAAALSLVLLILGTGLGLSAVSPWSMEGVNAATFGFATIAWLSFIQFAASGTGGYLAGRLRTKWSAVHTDEVFFRDTAHGFLTWAVASLLTAAVLTSVAGAIISGGVRAGAEVAGGAASAVGTVAGTAADSAATLAGGSGSDEVSSTIEYFVDTLFRGDPAGGGSAAGEVRELAREASEIPVGEVTRILARALRTGTLPQDDKRHIGRLIAERTDLSQQDAEQRVSEGFEKVQTTLKEAETTAREAADEAREASAYVALWMVVTLLIGAFTASLMAVFGGRQRDA
ncbi:MAG: hypothetical protein ABR578_12570 [Chromatocurvus sp.]